MFFRTTFLSALLSVSLVSVGPAAFAKAPSVEKKKPDAETAAAKSLSVVRVNATNQAYDFLRPWSKRPPFQRRAVGAVLAGSRVLTTAEQVANVTYLELEKPDGGEKCPATVEAVDYECNLAIVKPSNSEFLKSFKPLTIAEPKVGDADLCIWQLENNGTVLNTRALLTTAEVASYPFGDTALLLYRLTTSLQPRDSGFTSPVIKDGGLAGMLLRFDSRTQTADVIPAPVIQHFLKAAEAKNGYTGFPRAGIQIAALRDPQLRRYAGLTNGSGGVYISEVHPGSSADKAGIQQGDVLLAIGGNAVDQDGNYLDAHYGKVSITHLISSFTEGAEVRFKVSRQGKETDCAVTLLRPDPAKAIIEPYSIDKAPRYYVLGGLVFQELSRQFLKEWGPEWTRKAPERFLYYDNYQDELFKDDPRERIVIMSNVLPSPCTVGYEELNCLVVTKVNGVALKSLADIDAALEKPVDGFHRIQVQGTPGEIILDAKEVKAIEPALMKNYGLPAIKRL